jgi:predicted GH43/DUF377 family glycosyl hydrolase
MNWKKKGLIFKVDGQFEWMKEYSQVPTPVWLNDHYRIYFTTRHYPNIDNLPISSIAYVDLKTDNFGEIKDISKYPVLQHGELGSFDEFGQMPADIIKIDDSTYFMYYTGWSRTSSVPYQTSIGLAVSKDNCNSFQKIFNGPILGINKYDPILVNGPSVIKDENCFHMFYSSATRWVDVNGKKEVYYYIKKATSTNGIDWDTNNNFCLKTIIEDEVQNAPRVSKIGNMYHMWFCYRQALNFRDDTNAGYTLGLAISKDLENWERMPQNSIGICKSESGWDSEMMCYPYLIVENNKLVLLYNGNYFGKSGFGYAETEI